MEKLSIKYFKAFGEDKTVELQMRDSKSLLLYGENGSGKSSIYEAIKLIFFQNKIENEEIRLIVTPEEREQAKNDLMSSYNNKRANLPFELKINNIDYLSFDKSDYQVFMLSLENIFVESGISLKTLVRKSFFDIEEDIDNFLDVNYMQVEENVNRVLKNYFKENIEISIDRGDGFKCIIKDNIRNLDKNAELKKWFNEAKLNLILLLLHFAVIRIAENPAKKKLLVLDDFITSLDAANRTFLIRYIFETFTNDKKYQKFIFTHNISFYNLVMFELKEIEESDLKWEFCNIYEINNFHRIYQKSLKEEVNKIRSDFNDSSHDIELIGNRIRKKFEILLHEFSKLLQIGTVEESDKILGRLFSDKLIYYNNGKTVYDLIEEIKVTLNSPNQTNLSQRLMAKINDYRPNDYANLKQILRELKLYRKVTMHPMSHAAIGTTTFTNTEIKASLDLLEELETKLKKFIDHDIVNI